MIDIAKRFCINNIRGMIAGSCIFIFTIIAVSILRNEISIFDECIYSYTQIFYSVNFTNIMKIVTNLGGAIIIILIAVILCLRIENKNVRKKYDNKLNYYYWF